jgi:uncharacterized protein YbjT (DUF2867 family)
MKVAVVGGTGTVGRPLVAELCGRGDAVRVLSRGKMAIELPDEAEHRRLDLTSDEGWEAALEGVEAVVDAANSQKDADEVLIGGTRRLLAAAAKAGVRHHLLISIVGCDLVPSFDYYEAKIAQEEAVAAGRVPWSILRATQFHDLLDTAFGAAARWRLRPTGRARLQPIDPGIAAARLAETVHAEPGGRLPDIAGPKVQTLSELSAAWHEHDGRRTLPLHVPALGKFGRALAAGELTDPEHPTPGPSFEEWLRRG